MAVLLALPAGAGAVVAGPNGQLAFASGRSDGATSFGDANAQIWRIPPAGGTAVRITSLNDLKQHRHPAWSPDRRYLAYARCRSDNCGFGGPWDIILRDMVLGSSTNITLTLPNPGTADRPYFSPDGTRIAYARKPDPAATNTFNIYTQPVNNGSGGAESPGGATTDDEERPTWSADGQTIFYQRLVAAADRDVYKVASTGGTGTAVIPGATDDYQVATSPDGQNLCFVRGALGTNSAEVKRATIAGANITDVSLVDGVGSYNCVWSPDGTKIAYANGIFGAAALVMRNSDGTGAVSPITDCPGATCFDGNPDWAMNPGPTCQDTTATAAFNSFVTINLSCTDPAPESESTSKSIVTQPTHGNLGSVAGGEPAQVIYTPNLNFSGSDSFTFKGSDGTSDSPPATVTITVTGPGGGGGGGADTRAPVISSVAAIPARWRLGSLLPRLSLAPRGTTIRWRLDEPARMTLTFAKAANGRRVGRRCVRPTRANRTRRRCTRYLTKGALSAAGKLGLNRMRFQGRLSRRRTLTLGRYRLRVGAVDAAGNRSLTRTTFFTIVRR